MSSLPLTEASVRTRVVSWKDAAEMNDRVCKDALVIPRRTGLATAGVAFLSRANNPLVKRRREWTIDFSKLPNPSLFVGDRTQAIITLTRAQVVAAAVKKS